MLEADLVITGAAELLTLEGASQNPKTFKAMGDVGLIENGALAVKDGKIVFVGTVAEMQQRVALDKVKTIDVAGKVVMPGFIDCHTHLVFGGSREEEFYNKIRGLSYAEIMRRGGGILETVKKTRELSSSQLFQLARQRIAYFLKCGTTTIEVKSGYGLSESEELRILKIARTLDRKLPADLVITFLGAHAVPVGFTSGEYVQEVLSTMEKVADLKFVEFCDVFCEVCAFSVEEARLVLEKAITLGLKVKLHAGQFRDLGGVELGVELGAVSIDHLDYISDENINRLAKSGTVAVLLPGVFFHTGAEHYAQARKMIERGVPVALATDFNPGTSPMVSMPMVIALACRYMKMTPEETIAASTINAAHAIRRAHEVGSLEVGKKADIIIVDMPTYRQLPYWLGANMVSMVIKKGKVVVKNNAPA